MNKKLIVAPSILSADFANLEKEVNSLKNTDWVHVDVMDGHFVPNLTIGAPVVKSLRKVTDKILDVHLMIENPEKYIKDFAFAGSDYITFHYEAVEDVVGVINLIRSFDKKVGISIKPKTSVIEISEYINLVDMVLVMTVEPGFGGQKFIEECALKIKEIRNINKDVLIEVDGGINFETAKICKNYGADILVAGSFVFNSEDRVTAIESLK